MILKPLGIPAEIGLEVPSILLPRLLLLVLLQAMGRLPLAVHLRIQAIFGLYPTATPTNILAILP